MNVFDLFAKISLDTSEYKEKLSEVESKTSAIGSAVGTGLKATSAAVGATVIAAGGAIAKLTKSAVDNYAEYEQLAGGVSTLFGTNGKTLAEYAQSVGQTVDQVKGKYNELVQANDIVMKHAQDAWKKNQMSANEYLNTTMEFSASLIQSMGGDTKESAEKADMAISDMTDNANKMGSSIRSVQDAYRGFSRQNYTMLDNLKLGYGGTATEMARLINDSGVLGDNLIDLSDKTKIGAQLSEYGFATMVDAIHAVQVKMGVTGTSAYEAATTIQGSAATMKAAWEDLKTAFADEDADIGTSVENLSQSVEAFVDNVSPKIEAALPRIGDAIGQLSSTVFPILTQAIADLAPGLMEGVASLVESVLKVLPDLIGTTLDLATTLIPQLEKSLGEVLQSIGASLPGLAKQFVSFGQVMLDTVVDGINWVVANFDTITSTLGSFIGTIVDGLITEDNISKLTTAVTNLVFVAANWLLDPENLDKMLSCATRLIGKIGKGIEDAWEGTDGQPGIKDKLHNLIDKIKAEWNDYWNQTGEELQMGFTGDFDEDYKPKTFFGKLAIGSYRNAENTTDEEAVDNIKNSGIYGDNGEDWDKYQELGQKINDFPGNAWQGIKDFLAADDEANPFNQMGAQIETLVEKIKALPETISGLGDTISSAWDEIKESTSETWETVTSTLSEKWEDIKTTLSETWESIETTVSETWETVKEKTSETWENIKSNLSEKWESIKSSASATWDSLKTTVSTTWDNVKEKTSTTWENIKSTLTEKWESIKTSASNTWDSMKTAVSQAWTSIKTTIKTTINDIIQSALTWGSDMVSNFASGISSAWGTLKSSVSSMAGHVKSFVGFSEPEEGPLSDFHTYAPDMMELFAKGIKDNEYKVVGNVENVTSRIKNAFSNDYAVPNITTSSANSFNGSTSGSSTPVSGSVSVVNNFTINGGNASEISDTVAEKIQEALGELQIRHELALGR